MGSPLCVGSIFRILVSTTGNMVGVGIAWTTLFTANLAYPIFCIRPVLRMMVGCNALHATEMIAILGDVRLLIWATAHEHVDKQLDLSLAEICCIFLKTSGPPTYCVMSTVVENMIRKTLTTLTLNRVCLATKSAESVAVR